MSGEVEVGRTSKGEFGGTIQLKTYSDSVYHVHIWKVLLVVAIILGVTAFIVTGFFYPVCNGTQDRGFYSCKCKEGSALDKSGYCICMDTGGTLALGGCPTGAADTRYIFADARPDADASFGGWSTTTPSSC